MEKANDIVLAEQFQAAIGELLEERKREVRRKIQVIAGSYRAADGSVRKLKEQLAKAEQALEREKQKMVKLEQGDWSVLPDDKGKGDTVNANLQGAE